MRVALVPLEDGRPVELGRDLTLVGRSDEADLKLDHKSVSKLHCVLVRSGEGLLVRDLGSTNGTRINGQRVRRGALLHNDILNLAHYSFRVEIGDNRVQSAPLQANNSDATLKGNFNADSLLVPSEDLGRDISDPDPSNFSRVKNYPPPRNPGSNSPNISQGDSSINMVP